MAYPDFNDSTEYTTEVVDEQIRAFAKHGDQGHLPDGTGNANQRKVADAFKEIADVASEHGMVTWAMILKEEVAEAFAESDPVRLREELVQVEAMARTWRQILDARAERGTA